MTLIYLQISRKIR